VSTGFRSLGEPLIRVNTFAIQMSVAKYDVMPETSPPRNDAE
jgi:hypothetical protein